TAMSELPTPKRSVAKSAAAHNLAFAERLGACYDEVLQAVCEQNMRVPQLESLLTANTSRAAIGDLGDDNSSSSEDELSEVTSAKKARRRNLERERYWLKHELNLRARWRRMSSWAASGAVWRGRRHAVSVKLATCRVRAIKNANVDRRLID